MLVDPATTTAPDPAADAAALISFVAIRDAACPVCNYNLRGLKEARCPECSARLHLQVGSENLKLGPWFLAVLSFALALGFDGVVSLIMGVAFTIATITERPTIGQVWPMLTVLASLVTLACISGAGVWMLVRRRRAFTRLRPSAQWRIAVGVFITVFVVHALSGVFIVTRM